MEQHERCLTSNQRKSWTQGFLQMKRLEDKMMTHHDFPFPSQTVQSIRGEIINVSGRQKLKTLQHSEML